MRKSDHKRDKTDEKWLIKNLLNPFFLLTSFCYSLKLILNFYDYYALLRALS